MTTPPKPSDEAVEAAIYLAVHGCVDSAQAEAIQNTYPTEYEFHHMAARILAAALHHERIELGHANDLLDQIATLCEGSGVGLREDVRGVLAKRGA